jgi:hypothetical protein
MTAEASTIYLLDKTAGASVEAELRDAIEEAQLVDWQTKWQPALIVVLQELARQRVPMAQWPQSWHWDWRAKMAQVAGLLAFRGFSVLCGGVTQGLMRVDLTKSARESGQKGKPLVYVDYLEVAPWNRADLGKGMRYGGVGTALLSAAVEMSSQEDFKGRIGLHALPQSDGFYRDRCRMTDLGPDALHQGLRYFEMTPEQARTFLGEENEA